MQGQRPRPPRWRCRCRSWRHAKVYCHAKYVASSALKDPDRNNSGVLAGDVAQEVSELKEELDGEIVVAGSIRLVRTLMENDLVDELRPMVLDLL